MEQNKFQYAKLPKFKYQTFERHYQTFDRQTLKFSYHPVIAAAGDSLTPGNDQDSADVVAEKPAEVNNPADGSSGDSSAPHAEDSTSPDPGGKYTVTLIQWNIYIYGLCLIFH